MKFTARPLKTHLKKVKGRKASSTKWLQRQVNDPYVSEAHRLGYRGRAAFKIMQLDDQFHFFKQGKRVVDLGCAPGGWSQVAVKRVKSTPENPLVVGMDLLPADPIAGAKLVQMDFTLDEAPEKLRELLNGHQADIVMSDMAANTTGVHALDHLRIMNFPTTAPIAKRKNIGIIEKSVSRGLMLAILYTASPPSITASKSISKPSPKHSFMVSMSFGNSDIILPTLFR